jgi:LmbE family N-acetylglucosaminyl deacetylase
MSDPDPRGHPYRRFVHDLGALLDDARALPLGGLAPVAQPPATPAGSALVLAPHPDDECINGALALRLQRQSGWRVLAVPVTLGSDRARRPARLAEMQAACGFLGWDVVLPAAGSALERITPAARAQDPAHWQTAVAAVAALLARERPGLVCFPHAADWNTTHVGTHLLALDALAAQGPAFTCALAETEYWSNMAAPNLLVQSSPDEVGDLMAAVSCYEGEVRRNPFHLRLPAWMQDNVRRGGELVGGQGGAVPTFQFATCYRIGRWRAGLLESAGPGQLLPAGDDPAAII